LAGDLIRTFDFSLFSQRFSRVKKSNLTDDYRSWTFYSYLNRSAEAFGHKGARIFNQARGFDEFMKARVASAIVLGVLKRRGAVSKAA